jgi:catechol 2,3-dioxygenase
MNTFSLPSGTHIANVHLRVSDLDAAESFYVRLLGFRAGERGAADTEARIYATRRNPPIILLTEQADAVPKPPRTTGLYHVAIRLPSRLELARVLHRLLEHDWPLHGISDHGVSEAIYTADPDGNGIELYFDLPSAFWPMEDGNIAMTSMPLDPNDLLSELAEDDMPWAGANPYTDIGHVHLQVSDLAKSERFYHSLLGLEVTQSDYPGALFLSVGGYHHHVGVNVWASRGASPPPPNAVGLISFAMEVPDEQTWQILRDRLEAAGVVTQNVAAVGYSKGFLVNDPDSNAIEVVTRG